LDSFEVLELDTVNANTMSVNMKINKPRIKANGHFIIQPSELIIKGNGIHDELAAIDLEIDELYVQLNVTMNINMDTLYALNFANFIELNVNCIASIIDSLSLNIQHIYFKQLTGPTFSGFDINNNSLSSLLNEIINDANILYNQTLGTIINYYVRQNMNKINDSISNLLLSLPKCQNSVIKDDGYINLETDPIVKNLAFLINSGFGIGDKSLFKFDINQLISTMINNDNSDLQFNNIFDKEINTNSM